jgi:hypothetical protein
MCYDYSMTGLRYELRLHNRVLVQWPSWYVYSPLWLGNQYDTDYIWNAVYFANTL